MNRNIPTIFIVFMFLASTGCLDALTNSGDSGKFWGEDCEDVSEEICPSGEAPDFSLVDQNGDTIKGSKVGIERVGISNFRLPLKIQMKNGARGCPRNLIWKPMCQNRIFHFFTFFDYLFMIFLFIFLTSS